MNARITFSLPPDTVAHIDSQAEKFQLPKSVLVANAIRIAAKLYQKKGFILATQNATSEESSNEQ